jgi:AcrR family transcriptional regulator
MKSETVPRSERSTAEERREEVLRAAIQEFAQFGLHGASTERIARRVGISQPYIFRLFGTKKELFMAAVDVCHERIIRSFTDAEAAARAERRDVLEAMGQAFGQLLGYRDELLVLLHGFAASHDPEVRTVARERFGVIYRYAAEASGADEETLRGFFSHGMLLMVAAALDLPALCDTEPWAQHLLGKDMGYKLTPR